MSITRSEALAVARQHLEHGEGVCSASKWSEIAGRKPAVYLADGVDTLEDLVVYLQVERPAEMICSSEIMIIGANGKIRYKGSAHDEG